MNEEQRKRLLANKKSEVYLAMGYALDRWAYLEEILFDTFRNYLGADPDIAESIYRNSRSIEAKIDLIDIVMKKKLSEMDELSFWNTLKDYILHLKHFRNMVAHNPVRRIQGPNDENDNPTIVAVQNLIRSSSKRQFEHDAKTILAKGDEFLVVANLIVHFHIHLESLNDPPELPPIVQSSSPDFFRKPYPWK